MADGITFQSATPATPAANTEVATDDAGAAGHVQIIKLAVSADGSATVIPADATNGLLVELSNPGDISGGGTKSSIGALADPAPTTTATLLKASNVDRKGIAISNHGEVTVYLGFANTVTTATGFPLSPGGSYADDIYTGDWYGITAAGTGDIRVIEFD